MSRFVSLIGFVVCLGACDAEKELTPEQFESLLEAEGISVVESDAQEARGAADVALVDNECRASFVSCNPRTCGNFSLECDLAEWFGECFDLLTYHCGPR